MARQRKRKGMTTKEDENQNQDAIDFQFKKVFFPSFCPIIPPFCSILLPSSHLNGLVVNSMNISSRVLPSPPLPVSSSQWVSLLSQDSSRPFYPFQRWLYCLLKTELSTPFAGRISKGGERKKKRCVSLKVLFSPSQ